MKNKLILLIKIILYSLVVIIIASIALIIYKGYEFRNEINSMNLIVEKSIILDEPTIYLHEFICEKESIQLPVGICHKFSPNTSKLCKYELIARVNPDFSICNVFNYESLETFKNLSCSEEFFQILNEFPENDFFLPLDDFMKKTLRLYKKKLLHSVHYNNKIDLIRLSANKLEIYSENSITLLTKNGRYINFSNFSEEFYKKSKSILEKSKFVNCEVVKMKPD